MSITSDVSLFAGGGGVYNIVNNAWLVELTVYSAGGGREVSTRADSEENWICRFVLYYLRVIGKWILGGWVKMGIRRGRGVRRM